MSEREAMRMSAEEVATFLEQGQKALVSTNGPDGWPHVVPLSYLFLDGQLAVWTDPNSQKVKNLRRDPRITVLVEAGDRVEEFRAVHLCGRAEVIDDPSESVRAGEALLSRHAGGELPPEAVGYVAALAPHRVVVKVTVEKTVSWDHRKVMVDLQKVGS